MAFTGPVYTLPTPPPLTPPPNGLLRSAPVIEHGPEDEHWINGVTFSPESCAAASVFDPCTGTGSSTDVITTVTDGATTNGSATVTSATAKFSAADVGKGISGAGIPNGTTISGYTNATTVTISANATASSTGVTLTFTGRNPVSVRATPPIFQPFVVETYDTCSAFGFQQADYEGRARRSMAARETTAVEHEFALGAINSSNRHLQDSTNTTTLNSGTSVGLRTSLAMLSQAIADYGLGQGVIHARPLLVTHWSAENLLRYNQSDGKLYTYTGNLVVPGSGYTGAKPDGTAPSASSEWAYVTDPVQVHRGPVEVLAGEADRAASLDRTNNTVTVRAQRAYSVVFNACAVLALNVNTTSTS